MIKNQNGFSLVSVMVAAGIVGGVALLVMKLTDNMKGIENRSSGVIDAREALSGIRLLLENEKSCKLSLKGLTFKKSDIDGPERESGLPVELWQANSNGTEKTQRRFYDGMSMGKIEVNSLRLFMNNGTEGDYSLGPLSDLGMIRLTYTFQGQGTKTLIRDFLINLDIETDARGISTIIGCERSGIRSLCESLNMNYNSATNRCLVPPEVCDDWQVLAEGSWSGWQGKACARIDGGYVQSLLLGQAQMGLTDTNSMKIKCCYSRKYEKANCERVDVAGTEWWIGTKEGLCDKRPHGFIRKVEFYQGSEGGRDTNGMRLECCYPH